MKAPHRLQSQDGLDHRLDESEPHRHRLISAGNLDGLGLTEKGRLYVDAVASSPPARALGLHRVRNLIGDVPVPGLGVVLRAESASGEYFFLLEMLWRRDVTAIYDQPTSVPLNIVNRAGVTTRTTYTPDFLVVYKDCVAIYEVKADSEIERLCEQRKCDWRQENGEPVYVPARDYFEALGIHHRVVPNSTTSAVRADNLRMLLSVRDIEDTPRLARLREHITDIVRCDNLIQIGQLLARLHIEDVTPVLQLLDQGIIHVDLNRDLLSTPSKIWVASDPSFSQVVNAAGFRFKDAISKKRVVSTEKVPEPKHVIEVASRFAACGLMEEMPGLRRKSKRTIRRYRKRLRDNEDDPSTLFPCWSRSGNRNPRICQQHLDLINEVIGVTKGDPNRSSPSNGYLEYLSRCKGLKEVGPPVSPSTFHRHYLNFRSDQDHQLLRGGRRASNSAAASIEPQFRTLLPTRAFSVAHIDHNLVDISLLLGRTKHKPITRRPWLTAMVDAYSGEVLGLWLSYRSPCRHSCAMVIRDCVARHGRLPEVVVVDGGKDLDSVHFTALLATFAVTRFERPPEDPRFGKEVERLFGAFKENFARGLPGFVPPVSDARKSSGKVSPAHRARLKFHQLLEMLEAYVFNGYNLEPKPDAIDSRREIRAKSDASFPFNGRRVALDTAFLVQTAVDAPCARYQLTPGRGIRVYGTWYGCHALFRYTGPKKDVQVRIEPFDSSIAYICLGGEWHVCRSTAATINDALPASEVVERASGHHQLRALAESLAREAELESYEAKKSALGAVIGDDATNDPTKPVTRKSGAPPKAERARPNKRFEDIEDLSMDGE